MALPKQVQQQVKEAEQLMQQLDQGVEPANEQEPGDATPEANEPSAEPEAPQPEAAPQQPSEEGEPAGEPEVAQQEPPKKKRGRPRKADKENDPEFWKHKYQTLEGKYRSEVPQLHDQVTRLEQLLANLQVPEEVDPSTIQAKQYLTPEEVEDIGEDLIEVMGKVARQTMGAELEALKAENQRLREMLGSVATTAKETAQNTIQRVMETEVPGWEQQNVDEDFLAWLQQPDLYSGQQRLGLLQDAYQRGDVRRVVAFFKAFREERPDKQFGGAQPQVQQDGAQQPQPAQQPAPQQAQQPQVSMETLVAPGGAQPSGAQTATDEKQWFTRAEIAKFYDDVRRGKYRKNPDKQRQIEEAIFKAVNEGTIR